MGQFGKYLGANVPGMGGPPENSESMSGMVGASPMQPPMGGAPPMGGGSPMGAGGGDGKGFLADGTPIPPPIMLVVHLLMKQQGGMGGGNG